VRRSRCERSSDSGSRRAPSLPPAKTGWYPHAVGTRRPSRRPRGAADGRTFRSTPKREERVRIASTRTPATDCGRGRRLTCRQGPPPDQTMSLAHGAPRPDRPIARKITSVPSPGRTGGASGSSMGAKTPGFLRNCSSTRPLAATSRCGAAAIAGRARRPAHSWDGPSLVGSDAPKTRREVSPIGSRGRSQSGRSCFSASSNSS
jgi:hypothetical protein